MVGLRHCLVNFKEVFGTRILEIPINPSLNVTQFLENIKIILVSEFNINSDDIEIVETGQTTFMGQPEAAPKLTPSLIRISELWGENLQVSFYVRKKNNPYTGFRTNITRSNNECPICLESSILIRRYNCSHGICEICYERCQEVSINTCSLCRSH